MVVGFDMVDFQEKIKQVAKDVKNRVTETLKLLWQFKWYVLPYLLFYLILLSFYISPSPKQYNLWTNEEWFVYSQDIYLALTKLTLIVFALLFFVGISNMRNHPILAKLVFLSSLYFISVFLEIL